MRCLHDGKEGLKHRRDCNFRRELDLETLVCTRGRAFPLGRLAERLRCPRCGCRRVAVMFAPLSGDECPSDCICDGSRVSARAGGASQGSCVAALANGTPPPSLAICGLIWGKAGHGVDRGFYKY